MPGKRKRGPRRDEQARITIGSRNYRRAVGVDPFNATGRAGCGSEGVHLLDVFCMKKSVFMVLQVVQWVYGWRRLC
ncbi:hypothetical protein D3C81_1478660 [compost metagenome]